MKRLSFAALTVLLVPVACDSGGSVFDLKSPDIPEPINAANFVQRIDNPLYPLLPGMSWRYEVNAADGNEVIEVTVLSETREVEGVTATVVHDQAFIEGELAEDTYDWYAQDRHGNVWYLGEDTKEYRNGEVISTAGSWESGVDGALAHEGDHRRVHLHRRQGERQLFDPLRCPLDGLPFPQLRRLREPAAQSPRLDLRGVGA